MDYSSKSCLVYDDGLYTETARTLAKSFGRVYYYTHWQSAFPKSNSLLIGEGFPDFKRVNDLWEVIDDVDLFVFPDVYDGSLQVHLEGLGKRVWGSRMGEELELFRVESKEYAKSHGLHIGKYSVVIGIKNLREFLKDHENQYIKVSRTRGDFESFLALSYDNIEPKLDELEHHLGAKAQIAQFICEEKIENAVEVGYDGYSIDGQFPTQACVGIEVKSQAYIGHFVSEDRMPQQILTINDAYSEALRQYRYRNFFAVEARITADGTPWVIDPCCRFGSPPSEMLQVMYTNLADIFWYGAEGECIDPEPAGKWGAELILTSSWSDKNWQAVEYPKKYEDNVKFRNMVMMEGRMYIIPQFIDSATIGAVVAVGNTAQEAVDNCKKIAKEVKGYFVDSMPEALDKAQEEIKHLKEFGIEL